MSKPLSKIPEGQRKEVAIRRATGGGGGLGKVSALDFLRKKYPKIFSGLVVQRAVVEEPEED